MNWGKWNCSKNFLKGSRNSLELSRFETLVNKKREERMNVFIIYSLAKCIAGKVYFNEHFHCWKL